ncbi:antitoxin [Betaproteobacteria bacterium]|nr:antitoxin [Betaproteobacteria bacterium]GHU02401.1 antitoxin [Betaproteobacteria bacterium]GHU22119.1 antitoxin [Betaproteobacteria bacterium]
MTASTVFTNNRAQAVRLPSGTRFPASVREVDVRVVGNERIIAPADAAWDSFFFGENPVTEDFMTERADQQQDEREPL